MKKINKDRTFLIAISVDKETFKGKTDEHILEELFYGVSIPGGASITIVNGNVVKIKSTDNTNID